MKSYLSGSIAECLHVAETVLRAAVEDPRRDAEILLCAVLECNRAHLFAYSDWILDEAAYDIFCYYVQKRKNGEPVAYIIGKREFWSLLLSVNDSTLIPRPDTEVLVEIALQKCKKENACVIDLGTGSGAIALALASENPGWQVEAVDKYEAASMLAKRNADSLALKNVNVYQSDWFSAVHANTRVQDARFDLVVSNPPYIASDDSHLVSGDLRFEPHSALIAPDNGYADLYLIAQQAKNYLTQDGWLLLEHGYDQAESMRDFLQQCGYVDVETVKDYGGNERVVVGRWPATAATNHE